MNGIPTLNTKIIKNFPLSRYISTSIFMSILQLIENIVLSSTFQVKFKYLK